MSDTDITTTLEEADDALDAVRKAVGNDRPRLALRDNLDTLDVGVWEEIVDRYRNEAETMEEAATAFTTFSEAAAEAFEAITDDLPTDIKDVLQVQAQAVEPDTWAEQAGQLEQEAADLNARADAADEFRQAIEDATNALDEWEGAEGRDEKADARETLMDALGTLVETFDTVSDALPPV